MRTGEEGQNAFWLSQNTKRCPNCKGINFIIALLVDHILTFLFSTVHIEKNDGCMHMVTFILIVITVDIC